MNEGKKDRRDPIRTVKPRNFVAKNAGATTSGAGAHKDKKKAAKQGYEKHKKTYAESLEQKLREAFDFCPVCGCTPCNCTSIVAEGDGFDKIRKDAETNLNTTLKTQSDNRIAAKRNPVSTPKEKSFLRKVGDKQIAMVKGAIKGLTKGVAEGEYDPSYDPDYRPYQKPEQDPDAWKQQRDLEEPSTPTTVIIYDANRKEVLRFPSTGGYYGDIRYATSKGFNPESDNYDVKWQKDVSEDQGMTDIAAWKQAVLKAYPRYAGHIKFKGRGTQISAEVPGMDRSFGVFDLSTGRGEVLDEGKIYLEKLTNALAEAVKKI